MGRLEGRIACITGAGAGIGAAIARRFAAEGARVVVNDLDRARAEAVAKEVGGHAIAADVADPDAVRAMFREIDERYGRLDILVNNAGIAGHETDPEQARRFVDVTTAQLRERMTEGRVRTHIDGTLETSDAGWRRMIAVHLDGTFYCCREALRIMVRQETPPGAAGAGGAAIINMSSIMGTAGGAGAPAYCAAKAGILGLTRSLARELATRNIRVNAIAPGWIETAMTEPLAPLRPLLEAQTPLGRMGNPDDIAAAAVYLASAEAGFVTGQVLSPNGGWYMSQ